MTMTPTTGPRPAAIRRHATVPTDIGELLVVAERDDTGEAVVGIYFPGHWYPPAAETIGEPVDWATDELFVRVGRELAAYLTGRSTAFSVPVRTHGDHFSERVWDLLAGIPYGATTTYGELAARLGNRNLAQRVGQAVGHNPVSILIPCHRVIGADGSLTGYAGGLERKRLLLELEAPSAEESGRLF